MKTLLMIGCLYLFCSTLALAEQQTLQQAQQMHVPVSQSNKHRPVQEVEDVMDTHQAMRRYAEQYKNLQPVDGARPDDPKLIQLCILLDTSNSMDGLINQAKSQLWRIVNELAQAKKGDSDIRLEVALYEYGNDNLSLTSGYIRQVTPFTEDLDRLSEALFELRTNGGSEYCGHAIAAGLNGLKWNQSKDALKIIYIAGNEPFNQGRVNFKVSCALAAEQQIIVNTIHCGDDQEGIHGLWQMGATIGEGNYFSIDSDQVTEGIATPFDDELIRLNEEMNKTYIPYGHLGEQNMTRQRVQDSNASAMSKSVYAGRASSKGSKLYKASSWDLVDAIKEKEITIDQINREQLPEKLQNKTDAELMLVVKQKENERNSVRKQIAQLTKKRAAHIQKERAKRSDENSLGSAVVESLHHQAKRKNYHFK